jgi:glycosyltransferase involved in cell wall biosynthesis
VVQGRKLRLIVIMTVISNENTNLNVHETTDKSVRRVWSKSLSTVDVVIPCYNYARYLRACVNSVLSQPRVSVRVLVIDDASSDETPQVGQELASADSRVELRRHQQNKGHIATYNEGLIEWSAGDYAVLLSADDMLTPGSLSRAVRIMDADETIGMVYGRAIHFTREDEIPKVSAHNAEYTRFDGAEWLKGRCRTGQNVITSPEVVVRGSIQRAIGGYRPSLPHTGDLEMWLRIAAISNIAYVRNIPQALYRVHQASMIRTKYHCSFLDLKERKAAFDTFFRENRGILIEWERLQESSNKALAREALWDACRAYDHDRVREGRAQELIEFATATYSGTPLLAEHAAFQRRQRLGPVICNRTQIFAGTALVRRLKHRWRRRQWQRNGV